MQATWGIGTTLKVPTDLTDLFAVANDGAAIRQRLLHEALAKDRCNHGHYHKNGLVHWSSHSQSTHQMLRYYLSALEMQRPFNDPLSALPSIGEGATEYITIAEFALFEDRQTTWLRGMQSVSGSMFGVADTLTQQAGMRARLRELASVRRRFGYRRFTFCSHADLIH